MKFDSVKSLLVLVLVLSSAAGAIEISPDFCGVYDWGGWRGGEVNRGSAPNVKGVPIIMKWRDVEPRPGRFEFDRELGDILKAAEREDYYVFLMLWVGFCSPEWLYENDVPLVTTDRKFNALGQPTTGQSRYPYYFDSKYKMYFHRLIETWGKYLNGLPDELHRRIIFVQSAEGATGDGYAYKGEPLDKKFAITREQWGQFRIETWKVFKKYFQDASKRPTILLVNDDSSEGAEHDWLFANQSIIAVKQGMFSHGYHISDGGRRLDNWRSLVAEAKAKGLKTFTRGEMDNELNVMGWSMKNVPQALYWSAIYASHCGLDVWNVPSRNCLDPACQDALVFFNKYAGYRDAAKSPGAFCVLRRGIDAADIEMYPEEEFGKASKKNVERYVKICKLYEKYGAYQGDPAAATGGGMLNRKRKDYNDAGWDILATNYFRFMEQIEPDATSVAWWHKGPEDEIYSRFARGFEQKSGKTAMYFKLDDDFFGDKKRGQKVTVTVYYLDEGDGSWELQYSDGKDTKTACRVKCGGSNKWLGKRVDISGAVFNHSLARDSDLILKYLGGGDTAFHLIELNRLN
jgi:hypothetical protein